MVAHSQVSRVNSFMVESGKDFCADVISVKKRGTAKKEFLIIIFFKNTV
jgi:hypothetical protein